MGYSAQYLTNEEWMQLHAAYVAHGSGPEFWQVYQELQQAAIARHGEARIRIVNEFARTAERMGAIRKAILV
mgnify:CR=1 FL=1